MPTTQPHRPLWFQNPADLANFRRRLSDANFTDKGVLDQLGLKDLTQMRHMGREVLARLNEQTEPAALLVRLLLMGRPLPEALAHAALGDLDPLMASGLLTREGSLVHANFQILPFLGLYLAVDKPRLAREHGEDLPEDFVMGIGGSTQTLANVTVRRHAGTVLDMGTGCGVHALLAARHADKVIACDINPRAVALTEFNAALNGLTNIEARQGDMFDPVRDDRFDLIVTNPPFVISPETKFIYRDSPLPDDEVVQHVIRSAAPLLKEGGYCQMLCNWCHLKGQDTRARVSAWFDGLSCDAWVHESGSPTAEEYALTWLGHTTPHELKSADDAETSQRERLREWLAYYEERGIEGMSIGIVQFRRRAARRNWVHMDVAPEQFTMVGPAGDHVERLFANCTFLNDTSDETLPQACLTAAPDARLMQEFRPDGNEWTLDDCRVRLATGFAFYATLDGYIAKLFTACNGHRTVGELLTALARDLDHDETEVRTKGLSLIRGLIERGFLLAPPAAAQ